MRLFASTPSIPFSGVSTRYLISHACLAPSLTFLRVVGVFWRKFMAVLAMSSNSKSLNSSGYGYSQLFDIIGLFIRNNFCIRKATLGSLNNGVGLPSAHFSEVGGTILLSFDANPSCSPSVSCLLNPRSPSAVGRLVIPVCVNAIKGVFRSGFWTYVSFKSSKIHPFRADGNSPASVMLPSTCIRALASPFHRKPGAIKWRRVFKWHVSPLLFKQGNTTMDATDARGRA